MPDGWCRKAILDVLADDDAATRKAMTCADVNAMVQANDVEHSGDAVYKTLRRMADDGILAWVDGTFRRIG